MTEIASSSSVEQLKPSRRGCLFYVRRAFLGLGMVIIALIVLGLIYQTAATEIGRRNFQAPGQLIDVGGYSLHLNCVGEGSPTVILEAGGISYSSEWYWVQQQLATTNRVCSYDRAGMGWSEVSPSPRDGLYIVEELHTLLAEADIAAPYVLAGHSYGGVLNRIYASQYPDEVVGIVLVDTGVLLPATFETQSTFDQWKRENDILQGALWGMVRLGVYRLLIGGELPTYGYPEAISAELTALRSTNQAFDTYYAEGTLTRQELTTQSNAAMEFGTLPLMVLWATDLPPLSDADAVRYAEVQAEVASYSSNSAVRFIEGSSHGSIIGNETYAQQVTDAVRDVIASALTGEPLIP